MALTYQFVGSFDNGLVVFQAGYDPASLNIKTLQCQNGGDQPATGTASLQGLILAQAQYDAGTTWDQPFSPLGVAKMVSDSQGGLIPNCDFALGYGGIIGEMQRIQAPGE